MTTATITKYAAHIRETFETLEEMHETKPIAGMWWKALNAATEETPMSLKSWISNHDMLETLQVSFSNGAITRVWSPGIRELTVHASYVSMAGSRRYFSGVIHLAHSGDTWLGFDVSSETLIAYTTV